LLQDIDVIINHGRVDYLGSMTRTSIPLLCQFHTAIHQSDIDFVLRRRKARKKVRFVGVSQSHIEHVKPSDMIDVIYNGVDTERFVPVMQITKKYLAFLGRLTPDKGVEQAIQVARLAGIPLKIAGNSPDNRIAREYFEQSIKPHLGKGCEWIGPVNDRGKNELLGGAIAMLFPIQCGEPFGIVMIESLACGTPVIASRIGSTPEVIRHGKTGFLCDSVDDMVEAVKRIGEIDRRDCRSDVESRFSADIMVEQNLKVIEKILNN
jgi:glycosyltransferase involved in cell wall biosynthesis